jgi:hypothetical protein
LPGTGVGVGMDKLRYYNEMAARYRRHADSEPERRERHLADAEAWGHLADARAFLTAQQNEIRKNIAAIQLRVR